MKASEVLARYRNGERDFQGVNLRGQSFRGQDLSGADFSEADIHGTNFRGAILRGTKFCHAKAGLPRQRVSFRGKVGLPRQWVSFWGVVWFIWIVIAIALLTLSAWTFITFEGSHLSSRVTNQTFSISSVYPYIFFFLGSFLGAALAIFVFLAIAEATKTSRAISAGVSIAFLMLGGGAIAGNLAGTLAGVVHGVSLVIVFIYLVSDLLDKSLDGYQEWRKINENSSYAFVRAIAIAFIAIGGTSFREANLTDADFEGATLENTDLRSSDLTQTNFKDANLLLVRPGKTILANPAVIELLVEREGEGKDYTGANLRGANLVGANLRGAILKQADLADANLENAKLDGANLSQANAVGTNFRGASLAGACIEAWNIESSTILDGVDCRYIYLLEHPKPRTDDRERRPSSGEFGEGEFTKLFSEVMDTVDLIFRNGVDWKAFVSTFKKVQVENEGTPLKVQGFEDKGDGVVVVKVKVPPNTDKEKIHQEFTDYYGLALKAMEEKYKAQLEAKDNEIAFYRQKNADMMEMAKLLAAKPIHIYHRAIDPKNRDKNSADLKLELLRTLKGLIPSDLNELLCYLTIPPGIVPPPNVESASRVDALWTWAESPTGCGLDELEKALEIIRNKPEN